MMSLLVAQGRLRSIVIISTAILFIIMVTVDKRIKLWLFLVGIFLSLFAPVMMPYGITLGEILLAALFVDLFID
jgi:glucan phosphoethanolaminetransferase (alkaline phosphatase superfamily)